MKERLIAFNTTESNLSLQFRPKNPQPGIENLSQHHRRKAIRSCVVKLVIPRAQSVDLIEKTGLKLEDIMTSPEFKLNIQKGRIRVIEETHVCTIDDNSIVDVVPETPIVTPPMEEFNELISAMDDARDGVVFEDTLILNEEDLEIVEEEVVEVVAEVKPKRSYTKRKKKKAKPLKKIKGDN